jgi:hypothetical protein
MSTAYLATGHFKDQDSLSARIIQARFTGHFRFACQAFLEFMSDPTLSGAGSNNPELSAFGNPDDFESQYDRNWVAYASALFSESHFKETGHHYATGVHKFWQDNCEFPAVERSAVPTTLWRQDKKVYGEEDLFAHDVPVHNYAPLRAFGSLRQLRDLETGGDGTEYNEDYTNMADADQFTADRGDHRAANCLQSLYRERICNPVYKYSINDAIGNPPIGSNDPNQRNFIRDASRAKLPRWDMMVPNGMLGASGIRRPHPEGCGLNIESGGCDWTKTPNYYDSSLWSWAYVTSSQCEQLISNQHTHTNTRMHTRHARHATKGDFKVARSSLARNGHKSRSVRSCKPFATSSSLPPLCACAATPTSRRAGTGCSTSRRSRTPRAAPTRGRRASRRSTAPPSATTLTLRRGWPSSSNRSRWSGTRTGSARSCDPGCRWARATSERGASSSCRPTASTTWTPCSRPRRRRTTLWKREWTATGAFRARRRRCAST